MRIEIVTDTRTQLGESPMWDVDTDRLYWVDSLGRRVFRAAPDGGGLEIRDTPANIGSFCLTRSGGAIGAMKTGLHLIDFETGRFELIAHPEADLADNTLNDGKVDRRGRFWFGSMNIPETAASGSLYRLDPDFSLHKLLSGVTVSNGPCWSSDDRTFYFADSATATITAYDFDLAHGVIANPRRFLDRRETGRGLVDGATVDAEGHLWCAHVYGGAIARYAPDGRLDREIELPTAAVTSVMFGGPELDILFVTSMTSAPNSAETSDNPLAGALFAIHDLGIAGVPEPKFGY